MAVRVILEVRAKPGTGNELVALLKSILTDTRAYEGCTGVDVLQNTDDSDSVAVVETWDSHEQYEKYLAWQRERGTSDRLMKALADPPSIRHFDVVDA